MRTDAYTVCRGVGHIENIIRHMRHVVKPIHPLP